MFIKKTKMHKATTAQYLLEEFLTAADSVNVENSEPNSKQFHLVWISGHSGVQGNKKVDEEAKKGAQAYCTNYHPYSELNYQRVQQQ